MSFIDDAGLYAIYAVLSNNAYAGPQLPLPHEWRAKSYSATGTETGFAMKLFEHVVENKVIEVVLAFRGTDEAIDWREQNLLPFVRRQFAPAKSNFERIRDMYRAQNVRFVATGHSLAGGLALNLSFVYPNVSAVVFDSSPVTRPGLHPYPNSRVNVWESKEVLSVFRKVAGARWHREKQVQFNFDRGFGLRVAIRQHGIYALALRMLKLGENAIGAPSWLKPLLAANCGS